MGLGHSFRAVHGRFDHAMDFAWLLAGTGAEKMTTYLLIKLGALAVLVLGAFVGGVIQGLREGR